MTISHNEPSPRSTGVDADIDPRIFTMMSRIRNGSTLGIEVYDAVADPDTTVIHIDTDEHTGRIRVNINDAPIWDGDPETDEQPGAYFCDAGVADNSVDATSKNSSAELPYDISDPASIHEHEMSQINKAIRPYPYKTVETWLENAMGWKGVYIEDLAEILGVTGNDIHHRLVHGFSITDICLLSEGYGFKAEDITHDLGIAGNTAQPSVFSMIADDLDSHGFQRSEHLDYRAKQRLAAAELRRLDKADTYSSNSSTFMHKIHAFIINELVPDAY